jgi:hypothetical protein
MNLKNIKNFLNPDAEKFVLMLVMGFFFTIILLITYDYLGIWAYALSPTDIYIESTIGPSSSLNEFAVHAAVANTLDILYLYFLSCIIVAIYKRFRK